MRYSFHAFVAFILFPVCMFGRLGETEQELAARLGPPVSTAKEIIMVQGKGIEFGSELTFRQGDWAIECVIIDGRCAKEVYGKAGDWTEVQIVSVLNSNAQGGRWTDLSPELTKRVSRKWHRGDGAIAIWHLGSGMTLTDPAYERARRNAEANAKAEASRIPNI